MRQSSFAEARYTMLMALCEEMGMTLLALFEEYENNPEFKRRIDIAAHHISSEPSETLH
jgi:hypothetical protein